MLAVHLTEDERIAVASMLARYVRPKEVLAYVQEAFGKDISIHTIYSMTQSPDWKPLIEKYRRQWKQALEEVPLYNKKVRLTKLQELYDEVESTEAKSPMVRKEQREELISLLKEAREEAERYKGDGNVNILQIQYANMSDEELYRRRKDLLAALNNTGVSDGKRVAAQQGTQALEGEFKDA